MPETTGVALQALAGLVPRQQVDRSIDYLHSQLPCLVTPFSLAWTILGLAAWKETTDYREHISRVVNRQGDDISWDTVSLSLLLLAWHCEEGLCEWLQQSRAETSV